MLEGRNLISEHLRYTDMWLKVFANEHYASEVHEYRTGETTCIHPFALCMLAAINQVAV